MSITQYTVGAVKTFRGHDGNGFSCSLLKNKKKVAEVVDDGWGGGYQFHWVDHKTSALVNTRTYDDKPHSFNGTVEESLFYTEIMKLPKLPAKDDMPEMFTNPDIFVGELVNELLLVKTIKADLKKKLTIKCKDGELLTWKISTMHTVEILKDYAMKKHPEAIVINDLPIADVIEIYKEANVI
jgi:hypothetical protein